MSRAMAGILAGALVLGMSSAASAEESEINDNYGEVPVRRQGFAMGVTLGGGLASMSGYPNDVTKLNIAEYRASTGLTAGTDVDAWLGVALKDYLTFGLGLTQVTVGDDALHATGTAFLLHADLFPLYWFGGLGRDIALDLGFGGGGLTLKDSQGVKHADGGSMSLVQVGAYWEALRFSVFGGGPSLAFRHYFSQSGEAEFLTLNWRMQLYGGPDEAVREKASASAGRSTW